MESHGPGPSERRRGEEIREPIKLADFLYRLLDIYGSEIHLKGAANELIQLLVGVAWAFAIDPVIVNTLDDLGEFRENRRHVGGALVDREASLRFRDKSTSRAKIDPKRSRGILEEIARIGLTPAVLRSIDSKDGRLDRPEGFEIGDLVNDVDFESGFIVHVRSLCLRRCNYAAFLVGKLLGA
jgi:hypothetical protein